jgi:hypothetical protein
MGLSLTRFCKSGHRGLPSISMVDPNTYLPAAYYVTKIYVFRDHIYNPEIKLHAVLMMITEI